MQRWEEKRPGHKTITLVTGNASCRIIAVYKRKYTKCPRRGISRLFLRKERIHLRKKGWYGRWHVRNSIDDLYCVLGNRNFFP